MIYQKSKISPTGYINSKNIEDIEDKEKIENNQKTWKDIKSLKTKKMLLSHFIDKINENVNEEIIIQKNKLLLKSLNLNLKYINDDNIILIGDDISEIIGINTNENGLIIINSVLYKNKKPPR
jgi:hypothetical protein